MSSYTKKERDWDWSLLVEYLHYNGSSYRKLSGVLHNAAVALCDGYGKMSIEDLRKFDLLYDWSHVRDSSDEAIANCAAFIRSVI